MPKHRLFLTTDTVGGVWTYSIELAQALSGLDVRVVLVTLGPAASHEQREQAEGIPDLRLVETGLPLDWLASDAATLQEASKVLARSAGEVQADIVQLHAPALAASGSFGAPVISVIHSCVATWWAAVRGTELPADFAWRTELAREGMIRSDLLVTPTAAFARAIQTTYALPSEPVAVRNGRSAAILPHSDTTDAAFTAGRLWDEGKNVGAFDRAAACSSVPFRAAGPGKGPNGASVTLRHAEALGTLSDDQLAAALAQRPVFVSAARYEPFGLAVLEAAQTGCALVLSDIPTFRELWDGAALFVPDEAIAQTVQQLIADPEQREQLGEAARNRAARYTPEVNAASMLALYDSLATGERRAA